MKKVLFAVALAMALSLGVTALSRQPQASAATEHQKLVVCFFAPEAAKHSVEWRSHPSFYKALVANGMTGDLTDRNTIYSETPLQPGQLYNQIKGYHVVILSNPHEGAPKVLSDVQRKNMQIAGADLQRYIKEGGGLFLLPQAGRYPRSADEAYFNLLLEQFGATMTHEGLWDKQHSFETSPTLLFPPMKYFWTGNIKPHPVTKDVRGLALPLEGSSSPAPGVAAIKLDNDWNVVIAGEASAKSYPEDDENIINLGGVGSVQSSPPIAAVRSLGKGRIFIYNMTARNTFSNYDNRLWPQITASVGDPAQKWHSDGDKLLINAIEWLAQPALENPNLGQHQAAPIEPVSFVKNVNWDTKEWFHPYPWHPGIIGAHSNYTDGKGTVAEYAKAAKAAGLNFITFTDPLELLTKEKLDKLKTDCAAATKEYHVYMCPGVEFTDSLGVRWATWGENVVWPETTFKEGDKTYPVWDGKIIHNTGRYEYMCGLCPNAIIDYSALRKANASPGNMWFYYRVFPFAYDENKLIADNVSDYLFGLHDIRYLRVEAFDRLRSPEQIAQATHTVLDYYSDNISQNLNSSPLAQGTSGSSYVTQGGVDGPQITQWSTANNQMENPWRITRGAQRVRVRFTVEAPSGVAQVIVHDGNGGILRRYDANGAKVLSREFELVHDRQHRPVLEVIDTKGNRAISTNAYIFNYKADMWRTGDNLNVLSPGLIWHPDRNEMPSLSKVFENYPLYSVKGFDTGSGIVSKPQLWAEEGVSTTEGTFPPADSSELTNKVPDFNLLSSDLQIYSTDMAQRAEGYVTATRPSPAMGAISRRLGPLPYITRSQTTYVPAAKSNYYIIWNFRRAFEGLKDYQGDLLLTTGEIRFTKDVTLKGDVPVPLVYSNGGGGKYHQYDHFYVTDQDKGRIAKVLLPDQKIPYLQNGTITSGGYCAALNTDLGYFAFFAPPGSDLQQFSYSTRGDANRPTLVNGPLIGLGHDGQQVKAGTVWKYKFVIGTIANPESTDDTEIKDIARGFNLDGKHGGYPYKVQTGKLVSDQYFFTVQADNNEAEFSLGPRHEIIKLPIRVQGLEDNGCAANFVKSRGFFNFVPVQDGAAYFQEGIDDGTQMWVGNPFVCENKDVKLTLVVDGQAPGKAPLLEVHNPTTKVLSTRIYSPKHTPLFGGMSANVTLREGDSIFYRIENKKFIQTKIP